MMDDSANAIASLKRFRSSWNVCSRDRSQDCSLECSGDRSWDRSWDRSLERSSKRISMIALWSNTRDTVHENAKRSSLHKKWFLAHLVFHTTKLSLDCLSCWSAHEHGYQKFAMLLLEQKPSVILQHNLYRRAHMVVGCINYKHIIHETLLISIISVNPSQMNIHMTYKQDLRPLCTHRNIHYANLSHNCLCQKLRWVYSWKLNVWVKDFQYSTFCLIVLLFRNLLHPEKWCSQG